MIEYLAEPVDAGKAQEPFAKHGLQYRKLVLTFVCAAIFAIPYVYEVNLAYGHLATGIWSQLQQTAQWIDVASKQVLPFGVKVPTAKLAPKCVSAFKTKLSVEMMEKYKCKEVTITRKKDGMFGYLFSNPNIETLMWITDQGGALDVNSFAGAYSVTTCVWFLRASTWAEGFLMTWRPTDDDKSARSSMVEWVGRERVTYRYKDTDSGEEKAYTRMEFKGAERLQKVGNADVISFETKNATGLARWALNAGTPRVNISQRDLPTIAKFGIVVRYLPNSILPDPHIVPSVITRHTPQIFSKDPKTAAERHSQLIAAYSHLSGSALAQAQSHLFYGIDLAARGGVSISSLVDKSDRYHGFMLWCPVKFTLSLNGRLVESESREACLRYVAELASHQVAAQKLAELLTDVAVDPGMSTSFNAEKISLSADDLNTRAKLYMAFYVRSSTLEHLGADARRVMTDFVDNMVFDAPKYLPVTPSSLLSVIQKYAARTPWQAGDDITDIFFTNETLFSPTLAQCLMGAFGQLVPGFKHPSGTKFKLTGPSRMHYVQAVRVVSAGRSAKGNATTKEIRRHNELKFPMTEVVDAASSLEDMFRKKEIFIHTGSGGIPGANMYRFDNIKQIDDFWKGLVEAVDGQEVTGADMKRVKTEEILLENEAAVNKSVLFGGDDDE